MLFWQSRGVVQIKSDSKDDSGSQGQYREERRSERSKRENDADCRILRNDRQDSRTFQNNRHDRPARTQEEYKQKKHFSPRPHAHSHAFRHICTLTHMTVSTHAYLCSSHTSWRKKRKRKTHTKKSSSCTTLEKKNQCKTSFYLKRVREVPVKPKVKVSEGNRCSNYSGRVRLLSRRVLSTPSRIVSVKWQIWSNDW